MLIIRLVRLIFGYVRFSAFGGFPERFINLCARNNIVLWDIRRRDGVLYACTPIKCYRKIRPSAHKSGMKLRIGQRRGLPFIVNRYRKRLGILIGIAIFAAVLIVNSNIIWVVKVKGNSEVKSEAILQTFEELGLHTGIKKSSIDIKNLELEAGKKLPQLSWLSVNINGSTATIEVREAVKTPELLDENEPCNMKASFDGQIVRIASYDGNPAVKKGDSVVKGDLLISGIVENKDQTLTYLHARGVAIARTERKNSVRVDFLQNEKEYTGGEVTQTTLYFFGLNIPLYYNKAAPKGSYEMSQNVKNAVVGGVNIPISVKTKKWKEYKTVQKKLTEQQAAGIAKKQIEEKEKELMKGKKMISKKVRTEYTGSLCLMTAYYECEEDIAAEEALQIELPNNIDKNKKEAKK